MLRTFGRAVTGQAVLAEGAVASLTGPTTLGAPRGEKGTRGVTAALGALSLGEAPVATRIVAVATAAQPGIIRPPSPLGIRIPKRVYGAPTTAVAPAVTAVVQAGFRI